MLRNVNKFILAVISSIIASYIVMYANGDLPVDGQNYGYYIVFVILVISVYASLPGLVSYLKQFSVGKMRGLWSGKDLDNQIIKNYSDSEEIKIKVTRSYNLFVNKNNENFYKCIRDMKYNKNRKRIKLLMHNPCRLSRHVQRRAVTHSSDVDDFLGTWFEVVTSLIRQVHFEKNYNVSVEIRFFPNMHERWRFYWFRGQKKQVALLNYYDSDSSGDATPMYKVVTGRESLCDNVNKYFDEIWKDDSMCAISFLKDYFGSKNSKLAKCGKCEHKNSCKSLSKKYEKDLDLLSRYYPASQS